MSRYQGAASWLLAQLPLGCVSLGTSVLGAELLGQTFGFGVACMQCCLLLQCSFPASLQRWESSSGGLGGSQAVGFSQLLQAPIELSNFFLCHLLMAQHHQKRLLIDTAAET